jgi:hypothetical protein
MTPPMTHHFLCCVNRDFFTYSRSFILHSFLIFGWLAVLQFFFFFTWLASFPAHSSETFRYVFCFQQYLLFLTLPYTFWDQEVVISCSRTYAVSWSQPVDGTRMSFTSSSAVLTPAGWGMSDTLEGSFCHSVVNYAF